MMIGSKILRLLVVAAVGTALVGCRVKSVESFESAVNPSPATPGKGDPYTYGGMAEGTGGRSTRTSYASDNQSADPLSATETGRAGRIEQPRNPVTAAPPAASSITIDLSARAGGAHQGASATPTTKKP